MKIKHRVPPAPFGYVPPSHVETDEKYLAELEASRVKAERAWKRAQESLERAEKRVAAKPGREAAAARDAALKALEDRERKLAEITKLMAAPASVRKRIAHRAGQQDRLEVGSNQRKRRRQ